jgi:hypothetical protein
MKTLPPDATLHVALFAFAKEIAITPGHDVGAITIKPDGTSQVVQRASTPIIPLEPALLSKRLFFLVKTPLEEGVYRLRCNMYYQQTLVQSRLIRVLVSSRPAPEPEDVPVLTSTVDYTLSKTLNLNYLVRLGAQKVSFMMNENGDGTHTFRVFGEHNKKYDATVDARTLTTRIQKIRSQLREASWGNPRPWHDGDSYRYTGPLKVTQLTADLVKLAREGYRLYDIIVTNMFVRQPDIDAFRNNMVAPAPLEFAISNVKNPANYLIPAAIIYDYPFDTNLEDDKYSVCNVFRDAVTHEKPLSETRCFRGECPSRGQRTIVCPSGFWGFRHSIGLPVGSASDIDALMTYPEQLKFNVAVYPKFDLWTKHKQALQTLSPNLAWHEVSTRTATLNMLKTTSPHIIYFYCHGGKTSDMSYIEVGTDPGSTLGGITPDNLGEEGLWWNRPQPLIFINGCETTALEPATVLNFVTRFVNRHNACGVIGTEIEIFEELACAFAELFFHQFLQPNRTIGDAIRAARLALLQLGNPLGLVYDPFVNANLQFIQASS